MSSALLLSVRLHEGWYHGSEGQPSPARMFQALVAGAGISGPLDELTVSSLKWLERQRPPIVGVPSTITGQSVVNYVPNNDLDSKQADYRRIGAIRTKKRISPRLFDPQIPFFFAWHFEEDPGDDAIGVCQLAERVYQLGRTVDMAWAWAEVLPTDELQDRLADYPGVVRYPSSGNGSVDCPTPGSLESLARRYAAASDRFAITADRKGQTFRRRPKPKWRKVNYEGTTTRLVLELRGADDRFAPWPLERATKLVELLRDGAASELRRTLVDRTADIDRVLIGRKPSGENAGPSSARVRIIPLPSIGHPQADMQIRRVLIDIPGECPLRHDDVAWAFSRLQVEHPTSHDLLDVPPSSDQSMLKRFGVNGQSCLWRSITPVALPDAPRRRIDPSRQQVEAKSGQEKYQEQVSAASAVCHALRHANALSRVTSVRVQREPFDLRGSRAEPFAEGTRFNKHSLWHVELEFETPVNGPLVIGNGRFLGLGLMRPGSFPHEVVVSTRSALR